jgi:putative endonuclease
MLSRWLFWLGRSRPLGARGEDAALRYVRRTLGYRVIARNVRYTNGELDLVALDGKILVFVEVRTRSSETFGAPEQTIRHTKRQRVRRAARQFIKARKLYSLTPRIDVIAIVWPEAGTPEIRYHQNAFPMNG